jgi:hypothetical protein
MTRAEHLAWCKKRAHEYLDQGDITQAVTSMLSDLGKHPETAVRPGSPLNQLGLLACMSGDQREAARFIDGFN